MTRFTLLVSVLLLVTAADASATSGQDVRVRHGRLRAAVSALDAQP